MGRFQFSEGKMFENVANDSMFAINRFVGWILMDVIFYGGKSLFK
jgi:hypothetical protein